MGKVTSHSTAKDRHAIRRIAGWVGVWGGLIVFAKITMAVISEYGDSQRTLALTLSVAYIVAFIMAIIWTYRQFRHRKDGGSRGVLDRELGRELRRRTAPGAR